ncbi:hypothetical protein KI688_010657 [Linnemannia hyalina]|uniref:Uncharacterized protein n=1 Tax=Linnemannia hyalina TaxID=64524 RepID=A0A9P7XVW3_9FUNG|nr:hypothetical protein KI688_010657 [Linnemannia hyalina]
MSKVEYNEVIALLFTLHPQSSRDCNNTKDSKNFSLSLTILSRSPSSEIRVQHQNAYFFILATFATLLLISTCTSAAPAPHVVKTELSDIFKGTVRPISGTVPMMVAVATEVTSPVRTFASSGEIHTPLLFFMAVTLG